MTKNNNQSSAKRRKFNARLKFQLAIEAIQGRVSQIELSRQYNINQNLITRWRKELLEKGYQIFENGKSSDKPERKIEELEKLIGKKEIEIQLLKKFLGHYSSTWLKRLRWLENFPNNTQSFSVVKYSMLNEAPITDRKTK